MLRQSLKIIAAFWAVLFAAVAVAGDGIRLSEWGDAILPEQSVPAKAGIYRGDKWVPAFAGKESGGLGLGEFLVDEARSFGAGALDGEQLRKALANRAVGKSGSGIRDWMASRWENAPGRFGAHMAGYAEGRLESLAWVRDADIRWTPSADDGFGAFSVGGVGGTHTGTDSFFGIQPKIRRDGFGDLSGTFGVFQRRALGDWGVVGVNAFADYKGEARGTFSRYWLGADFASAWVDADVKRYFGGDGRTFRRDGKLFRAYTPDGVTGELRIHSPGLRWLEAKARFSEWQGRGGNGDRRSQSFGMDYIPAAGWRFGADYDGEHAGADFGFAWALGRDSQIGGAERFNVYSDLVASVREDGSFPVEEFELYETAQLFEQVDAGMLTLSAESVSVAMSLSWNAVPEWLRIDEELRSLCTPPLFAVNNRVVAEGGRVDFYTRDLNLILPREQIKTWEDAGFRFSFSYHYGDSENSHSTAVHYDINNSQVVGHDIPGDSRFLFFMGLYPNSDGVWVPHFQSYGIAGSTHTCLNVLWGVDTESYRDKADLTDLNLIKSLVLAGADLDWLLADIQSRRGNNSERDFEIARILAASGSTCYSWLPRNSALNFCTMCQFGADDCNVCVIPGDVRCKFTYPADWTPFNRADYLPPEGEIAEVEKPVYVASHYVGPAIRITAATVYADVDFTVTHGGDQFSATIAGSFESFTDESGSARGRRNYQDGANVGVVNLATVLQAGATATATVEARFFHHVNELNTVTVALTLIGVASSPVVTKTVDMVHTGFLHQFPQTIPGLQFSQTGDTVYFTVSESGAVNQKRELRPEYLHFVDAQATAPNMLGTLYYRVGFFTDCKGKLYESYNKRAYTYGLAPALWDAAKRHDLSEMCDLLRQGANPNYYTRRGSTAHLVDHMLRYPPEDVETQQDMVYILKVNQMDFNYPRHKCVSRLGYSSQGGVDNLVHGASRHSGVRARFVTEMATSGMDMYRTGCGNVTPAMIAASEGNKDLQILSAILIRSGSLEHRKFRTHRTALHYAARNRNGEAAALKGKALMLAGADVNAQDYKDYTPLMVAIFSGSSSNALALEIMRHSGYLRDYSGLNVVDWNARDDRGRTILHHIADNNKTSLVREAMANMSRNAILAVDYYNYRNPNDYGRTARDYVTHRGEVLDALREYGVRCGNPNGSAWKCED